MMRTTCLVILVSFLMTCYFGLGYSEVTKDLPQELEIETLKATVETLTKSYNSLCEELQHLSRHVLFHERAIKHMGLQGHHGYGQVIGVGRRRFRERKHRFPLSEHHGSLHNSVRETIGSLLGSLMLIKILYRHWTITDFTSATLGLYRIV